MRIMNLRSQLDAKIRQAKSAFVEVLLTFATSKDSQSPCCSRCAVSFADASYLEKHLVATMSNWA